MYLLKRKNLLTKTNDDRFTRGRQLQVSVKPRTRCWEVPLLYTYEFLPSSEKTSWVLQQACFWSCTVCFRDKEKLDTDKRESEEIKTLQVGWRYVCVVDSLFRIWLLYAIYALRVKWWPIFVKNLSEARREEWSALLPRHEYASNGVNSTQKSSVLKWIVPQAQADCNRSANGHVRDKSFQRQECGRIVSQYTPKSAEWLERDKPQIESSPDLSHNVRTEWCFKAFRVEGSWILVSDI